MKVYNKLTDFKPNGNAIVTAGMFDGVHLAHQKILAQTIEKAKSAGGESVLLTFWPHPRMVLAPVRDPRSMQILTTIEEKADIIAGLGIDHMVILPFTREFSELSREQYIEDILISGLGTRALVIGYDHRFGKNREGGIDYLIEQSERFKIEVEEINRQEIDHMTISSTKIRNALTNGEIKTANDLLGRKYGFSGTVVKGRQFGRKIGFPTANISIQNDYKLVPRNGIYAVYTQVRNKTYMGAMSIGTRPTVDGVGITQEVYILDFSDDIYGEEIKVEMVEFLRDEEKFDTVDLMVEQMHIDVKKCREILSK